MFVWDTPVRMPPDKQEVWDKLLGVRKWAMQRRLGSDTTVLPDYDVMRLGKKSAGGGSLDSEW